MIGSREPAFRIVGRRFRDRFHALLTVSLLPGLPVALAWWLFLLVLSRDGVVVNGIPTPWEWTSTPVVVTTGILGVASALVSAVSLGAGVIISGAAMLGQEVTPGAALRRAVRRVPAIVVWWLLVVLAATAALIFGGYVVVLLDIEYAATPLTVVIGLVPFIYFTWIVVALPVALLENKGLFRSLGAAWSMGLDQRAGHAAFVIPAFGLGFCLTAGVGWGLSWLGPFSWGETPSLIITALLTALVWPLLVMLLTAPAFLDLERPVERRLTRRLLDTEEVQRQLPRASTSSRNVPSPTLAVALAVLALLPTVAQFNPAGAPMFTSQPVGELRATETDIAIAPTTRGTALGLHGVGTRDALTCEPGCAEIDELDRGEPRGESVIRIDDTSFFADWNAAYLLDGLRVRTCHGECPQTPEGWEEVTTTLRPEEHSWSNYSAMAASREGLLVASSASFEDGGGGHELRVHHCPNADCADPDVVDLPSVPVGVGLGEGRAVDVAAGPEAGFAVSALDGTTGEINLITCADLECDEPQVTQIAGPLPTEIEPLSASRIGATVSVKPDGSPVLTYRAGEDGATHFVDCADLSCDEFTSEQITGPGWKRPPPALALDSAGLPQLATFDLENARLTLVSCADSGCAETSEIPLEPLSSDPQLVEMELDTKDRPHIVWGEGPFESSLPRIDTTLTRCTEPRCGA